MSMQVTQAYITSRLGSVAQVVQDSLEDPLDDHAVLSQQLEQVHYTIYLVSPFSAVLLVVSAIYTSYYVTALPNGAIYS